MLKPDFTEAEIEQLYHLFMEHPSGAVKKRLHVVYLKALGLPHQDIVRIARVSGNSVTRYLKAYVETVRRRCAQPSIIVPSVRCCRTGSRSKYIFKPIRRIPLPKPRTRLKSARALNWR